MICSKKKKKKNNLNEKLINEFLIGIFLYSTKLTPMIIFLLYILSDSFIHLTINKM